MSYWQEKVKIGSLTFPRFMGGPLDGITDSPFRKLVREFSPHELLFTEMRHVACVARDKTGRLSLDFDQAERPLNYQIAACKEDFIDEACDKIIAQGVDILDLNIGCPAKNVISSGSGSALMADLPRLKIVLQLLRKKLSIPFTVKIRAGFKQKNALDVARLIEECGADAISIHPRLQTEMFAGRPDYALAGSVKQAVSIPVFLSGNIINWKTAQLAYEQTGVDGFLIGRGMWSKPWKLYELQEHAAGRPYEVPIKMALTYAYKHFENMEHHYGARGVFCFRKHLPFYLKGLPGASALRQELVVLDKAEAVKEVILRLIGTF